MLTREEILTTLKKNKPQLAALGVQKIGLFGSFVHNQPNKNSDIDIFAELSHQDYKTVLSVLQLLENVLPTKVDLTYKGPHLRAPFLETIQKEVIFV